MVFTVIRNDCRISVNHQDVRVLLNFNVCQIHIHNIFSIDITYDIIFNEILHLNIYDITFPFSVFMIYLHSSISKPLNLMI